MRLNKKVKMGEFYIVRLKDEFYHYGIKGMKLSDIYNKDQIIFLKTLNLDFEDKESSNDDLATIEEIVGDELYLNGFDSDDKPTEIAIICESILDLLP